MNEQRRRSLDSAPLQRLVSIAGHLSGQRWSRVISAQHGLTPTGARALLTLASGIGAGLDDCTPGRATSGDLARRMWIRPASMTGVVDNLERDGLVQRSRDDADRRQVWISLTPFGAERVRHLRARLHDAFAPTDVEQDGEKAAIVRQYLIELIAKHHEEDCGNGEAPDQFQNRPAERPDTGRRRP